MHNTFVRYYDISASTPVVRRVLVNMNLISKLSLGPIYVCALCDLSLHVVQQHCESMSGLISHFLRQNLTV